MSIEIRELIIEARVVAGGLENPPTPVEKARIASEDPVFMEGVVRLVLEALREQQERV